MEVRGIHEQDKWRLYQSRLISTVQNSLFSTPAIAECPSYAAFGVRFQL